VRDHYTELKKRGIVPIGISDDPVEKNMKFAEKHDLQYQLLSDEDATLLTKLDTYGEKKMYGKTYKGTKRQSYIVDKDGVIRKVFKKVNTAEHGQEILDAVEELGL
jgi:peroxiredoxin Q/BCP